MKIFNTKWFAVILLTIGFVIPEIVNARGFSSGGRSSFSSSRSSSWGRSSSYSSSKSSNSGWGSSSSRSSSKPSYTSSRSVTTQSAPSKATIQQKRSEIAKQRSTYVEKQLKPADKQLYTAAKKNGTSFKSKADAQKAFKEKYATQYTSKYATKPATRPSHIPSTYSTGGKTYNVTYNSSYGGYGYMGPSGSWIMYNAMADAVMYDTLMRRHNYYYTPSYVTPYQPSHTVVYSDSSAGSGIIFTIMLICVVLIIFAFIGAAVFGR